MKKYNKFMALALLTSVIGTQFLTVQAFSAQATGVYPPAIEKTPQYNQTTLPKINLTPFPQNTIQQVGQVSPQTLKGQISTIPVGTSFNAVVNSTANSSVSQIGDLVTATITNPVIVDGNVVIPEGSQAIGQITYVDPAGRIGKDGAIDLRFTSINLPNGQKIPLTGKIETVDKTGSLKGGSLKKQIVTGVGTAAVATGAGTLTGLTIGGLAGVPARMTVFGTALGGFLGLGYVFARKGKDANLPLGTLVKITLDQPASIAR